MSRKGLVIAALALGLALGALAVFGLRSVKPFGGGPDAESIATASLQAVREQNRLTPFTARYVAVVTSTRTRFGLKAQKTLIMPGTVRYEIDLSKLGRDDLAWDRAAKTLTVTLPPVELAGPEVDLAKVQEYSAGGILASVTDAESALDAANRQVGRAELLKQARSPEAMRMARDAARRAVERSFALPLAAAGLEARVAARFADEAGAKDPSWLDRSRRMEDVLNDKQAAR